MLIDGLQGSMNMHDTVAYRDENGLHADAMPVDRVLAGKMMVKQRTMRIVKTNRHKGAEFDKMAQFRASA